MTEALEAAGAPSDILARMRQGRDENPDIQPANALIAHLFFTVATQWRHAGMSGTRTGLDYTAVAARIAINPEYASLSDSLKEHVWSGLKVMELAALTQWNADAKTQ